MTRKRLRRRVVSVDASGQRGLFAQPPTSSLAVNRCEGGRGAFIAPDPQAIRINEASLEHVLRDSGQRAPLKIRAWLAQMNFDEFEAAYDRVGRPPYAPRAVLGIVLSGILQGITSLRDLERFARLDLGCWWVSGGIMPDHSVLGRFIHRHQDLLTESFFDELTRAVLKLTHSGTAVVAGDGTIIEAAASRYRLMRAEALQQAMHAAREQEVQGLAHGVEAAAAATHLQHAGMVLQGRAQARREAGKDPATTQINVHEPEAVIQPQKNKPVFAASYKPSVLANRVRVILACEVHPSSETQVLAGLLARASGHGAIESALLDAGYFSDSVIQSAAAQRIELFCPEGRTQGEDWNKDSQKYYLKSRFVYEPHADTYRCPQGECLTPRERYRGNDTHPAYVLYATAACTNCPVRARCTSAKMGRRIKRYAGDAAKDALRAKMRDPRARQWYRQRQGMVEPVFSQLRGSQGLHRFRRNGLQAVRVEFALHAMAYNLSRALALVRSFLRAFAPLPDLFLAERKTRPSDRASRVPLAVSPRCVVERLIASALMQSLVGK